VSNELGIYEVYVRAFPGPGGVQQISTGGGGYPKWSPNGKELFYLGGDWTAARNIMVTTYTASSDTFRFDKPRPWSPSPFSARDTGSDHSFDIHPDGKRFAVLMPTAREDRFPEWNKVSFIFNFFDELRGKLPGKN
jgi:hypothetical protein